MSFILDALRKSENARQRQGGPALAEVPIARRRENRPWWIWAVAALLAINLIVLLVVLTRSPEPEPVAALPTTAESPTAVPAPAAAAPVAAVSAPVTPAPAPAAQPTQAAAATQASEPGAMPRSLAEEAASTDESQDDPDAPSGSIATAANVPDRDPIVRTVTPGSTATANPSSGEESLPTLNELTGDRAAGMPAMHIDIHVYSTNPAERFVFINMRKYVEGATLTEGPVLERIRTDGVVLNQRGFRFILPRQ